MAMAMFSDGPSSPAWMVRRSPWRAASVNAAANAA